MSEVLISFLFGVPSTETYPVTFLCGLWLLSFQPCQQLWRWIKASGLGWYLTVLGVSVISLTAQFYLALVQYCILQNFVKRHKLKSKEASDAGTLNYVTESDDYSRAKLENIRLDTIV